MNCREFYWLDILSLLRQRRLTCNRDAPGSRVGWGANPRSSNRLLGCRRCCSRLSTSSRLGPTPALDDIFGTRVLETTCRRSVSAPHICHGCRKLKPCPTSLSNMAPILRHLEMRLEAASSVMWGSLTAISRRWCLSIEPVSWQRPRLGIRS